MVSRDFFPAPTGKLMYRYRFAVLKYYCDLKLARGKSKAELREKIMILENEVSCLPPPS